MENQTARPKGYENKALVILFLVCGFVMMDRQALSMLSVFLLDDLGITTAQFGYILSGFAFTWAISGYLGGYISDKFYNKKKLLLGLIVLFFSLFSFSTGLAKGYVGLFAIRLMMGVFEGPSIPVLLSIMATESTPERRGFNLGVIQSAAPALMATVIGPIVLVALAQAFNWRVTFFLTIIPGLILAFFIFKTLKEPYAEKPTEESPKEKVSPVVVFKNRNSLLSFIMSPFVIGWYILIVSFAPLYLVSVKGLTPTIMSFVIAAMGIGGIVWTIIVSVLADKFGRKPIFLIFMLIGALCPLGMIIAPATSVWLIAVLVFIGYSGMGACPLFLATIPSESVGLKYAGTAMGTIMAFGELGGGVAGSTIAGILGMKYGLGASMWMCVILAVVATLLGIFYYETAPVVLAKRAAKQEAAA